MSKRYIAIISLWVLLASSAAFASVFGTIKTIVHDPQHRPVQGAQVEAHSRTSAFTTSGTTNEEGMAQLSNVPVGEYDVKIVVPGFSAAQQSVTVTSSNVQEMHFALALAQHQETVDVSGAPETVNPSSAIPQALVSRSDIAQTPGADRTNSMSMITDFVPGASMVHDQLHVRGGHQVTWAIDGVPVPNTNIATNVGPQFDPKDIDYMEVQRGSFSAESGDRTYGVFNVVTRSGFERSRQAELVTSYGNLNSTDNQLSFGDHNDRSAYYFSVNGNRTDHGLETPTTDNLHNQAAGGGAFTSLIFNATPKDQLRFVGSGRTDFYQVPNGADLQSAGVRDREREQDIFGSLSWIHTFGPGVLLTLSPSYHFNRAAFEGLGAADQRLVTTDNRASSYAGGQASVSVVQGRHNASIGFYGFAQHDNTLFGLAGTSFDGSTDPPTAIPVNVPLTRQKVSGDLEAVWIQDQYKASSWLSLTAGVRFTRFAGLVTETAGSPRLGVAIQIPRLHWVLRGSYSRYYQAPPLDTVSSDVLTAVSPDQGFLPLRGERDEQHDIGLTIPVRGWTLDFDHFRTGAHNFFDHDALGNSNLFIPLTIQSVRILGYEATVRSPKLFKKIDLHLAYSHQSVEGSGGVTGGLTDFAPPDAGFFFLDHDQRHTLSTGFTALLPARSWLSGNVTAGSGFLDGNGPGHLPSYATVDLAVGHSFGENWSAKLTATNLADKRYFIDRTNSFGGSHVSDPRMVSVQLRYKFHY
ncbi:MAG TPA: TonB-dependent receptor [Candidatus Dormibacteraeota bacterium]|nr:TonB-dependent receptor [Candidatus Dormibacteraeota bacterium]